MKLMKEILEKCNNILLNIPYNEIMGDMKFIKLVLSYIYSYVILNRISFKVVYFKYLQKTKN